MDTTTLLIIVLVILLLGGGLVRPWTLVLDAADFKLARRCNAAASFFRRHNLLRTRREFL